jgi:hypothetical protein
MTSEAQLRAVKHYRDRIVAGGGIVSTVYLPGPAAYRARRLQEETGLSLAALLRQLLLREAKRQGIIVEPTVQTFAAEGPSD